MCLLVRAKSLLMSERGSGILKHIGCTDIRPAHGVPVALHYKPQRPDNYTGSSCPLTSSLFLAIALSATPNNHGCIFPRIVGSG